MVGTRGWVHVHRADEYFWGEAGRGGGPSRHVQGSEYHGKLSELHIAKFKRRLVLDRCTEINLKRICALFASPLWNDDDIPLDTGIAAQESPHQFYESCIFSMVA